MLNESIHVHLNTYIRKTISIKDSVVKINSNKSKTKNKRNKCASKSNTLSKKKKKSAKNDGVFRQWRNFLLKNFFASL